MSERLGVLSRWSLALLFPIALWLVAIAPVGPGVLWAAAVVLVMALPLGLMRRHPGTALTVVLISGIALMPIVHQLFTGRAILVPLLILADLMVGAVAASAPRRRSIPAALATVAVQMGVTTFDNPTGVIILYLLEALAVATAWLIGNSVRQRRLYAAAQRVEAEMRAVQAERLRIARELHDMIAHSIGVIAVQAGMGRRVIDTQPAEARNALANIEETSRDTAAALRRMLGTLRRNDLQAGAAARDPAPGLDDLEGLVRRTEKAGLTVNLLRSGAQASLPPDIELSAFRIVQEAMTNVIRHAGTDRCDVVIEQSDQELTIEVIDGGRGAAGGSDHGYGIAGMRERVSLLGGEFRAGPGTPGGFHVHARIPLPRDGA
ncbi:two-component sensor histidine kinase [Actinoplanes ianthinogenes]|uniref:histidine kinase n=1 Tax=Actinoplanes ianthinogenes TaxID=122358 RepID=A0ABM7M700_9ACTN|nr:sensor histidine kinase [Actinoplanes ianthinogenes]BCJ47435.1 two-component sensor histidine kinase [Actinoplanes ianthinogenes]GGR01758.1 two-component sensor histidine kinase [Actinoplanes ianthinogenes]